MTGWPCPSCGDDSVVSRRNLVRVFDHRAIIREDPRGLARELQSYGVGVRPEEPAEDCCRRWAEEGVKDGPGYICTTCLTLFSRLEVGP